MTANWLLIDVSNWAYRDIHAIGPGAGSLGAFTRRVEFVQRCTVAERTVFCFDSANSFRRDLCGTYKANRKSPPIGLGELLRDIEIYAIESGIDIMGVDGFEADDCIATLTALGIGLERNVVIASTDKDLRQLLIDGRVCIIRSAKTGKQAEVEFYNTKRLAKEYGLRPDQWIDYQALVGDKSDNVPGCDGIGTVAAIEILTKCGSLDDFWAEPFTPKLTGRQRTALQQFRRGGLEVARQMVTLRRDVPLPESWSVEA